MTVNPRNDLMSAKSAAHWRIYKTN